MTKQLVEIHPTELNFIFELKKQSSCSIQLLNTSDQYIAYKVKTTSPKKYCVRPNVGVVSPHSPCEIIVTMQAQRTAPPDMQCKDKFLVQSTVVQEGTTMDQITSNMFAKEKGRIVDEKKLKVALISPPHSPVLQPISGVINQAPVFGTPKPMQQDNSSSEDSREDSPPPPPPIVTPVEELKPKVTEDNVEELAAKLNEADELSETGFRKPVAKVPLAVGGLYQPDLTEQLVKLNEPDVEELKSKLDKVTPFEELKPKVTEANVEELAAKLNEADELSETGFRKPVAKVPLAVRGLYQPDLTEQLVKLNEPDVEELKSKLDKAENIIRSLREEKSAIMQQQALLRQELMVARRRSPQVRAGYSFLFVCFIGIVGLIFGLRLSS